MFASGMPVCYGIRSICSKNNSHKSKSFLLIPKQCSLEQIPHFYAIKMTYISIHFYTIFFFWRVAVYSFCHIVCSIQKEASGAVHRTYIPDQWEIRNWRSHACVSVFFWDPSGQRSSSTQVGIATTANW